MLAKAMALSLLLASFAHGASAQGDWKASLRTRIIMDMGFTGWAYPSFGSSLAGGAKNAVAITRPGKVYLMAKDGLVLATNSNFIPTSTVISGDFEGAGGRRRGLDRILKAGEGVYLLSLDVDDDSVTFGLLSKEHYEYQVSGTTSQYRLRGNIKFAFPRGSLAAMPFEGVRKTFSGLLRTAEEASQPDTKTIELGQTLEEVEAILGKPETVVKLGEKTIYAYKSMKVIFMGGKVADVQ
jgi:hypothetical protein